VAQLPQTSESPPYSKPLCHELHHIRSHLSLSQFTVGALFDCACRGPFLALPPADEPLPPPTPTKPHRLTFPKSNTLLYPLPSTYNITAADYIVVLKTQTLFPTSGIVARRDLCVFSLIFIFFSSIKLHDDPTRDSVCQKIYHTWKLKYDVFSSIFKIQHWELRMNIRKNSDMHMFLQS
jgi:hypothetical protein